MFTKSGTDAIGGVNGKRIKFEGGNIFSLTNTPTIDISKLEIEKGTINAVDALNASLADIDIKGIFKKSDENLKALLDAGKNAKSSIEDKTRSVKGLFSSIKDIASIPGKELDKKLGGLFPKNSPLTQIFTSGINKNCSNKSLKFNGLGKPYNLTVDCGTGKNKTTSSCNNGQFSDVLNKLTGGLFNSTHKNLNESLASLSSLAGYGYELNMCGVFSALSAGIDNKDVIDRSAGGLVNALSSAKNAIGLFDISKATTNAKLYVPGIAGVAMAGYSIPKTLSENLYPDFANRAMAATDLLEEGWDIRKELVRNDSGEYVSKNFYNIGTVKGKYNDEFQPALTSLSSSYEYSKTDIDYNRIPDSNIPLLLGGLGGGQLSKAASFNRTDNSISILNANDQIDTFEKSMTEYQSKPSLNILVKPINNVGDYILPESNEYLNLVNQFK